MAQEIYHRSEWGNPTETWGNVYLNADLTNELYKRASEYENSWVTDQLLNGVGTKPSIILTPTAYEDGVLNSVKPSKPYSDELVVNGNFDTDSDWTKDVGWTISNGEAIHTGSGSYISQTGTTIGKNYRVVIEVTQASGSGFPQIYMGGLTTAMTSVGTYTFDITATTNLIRLRGVNDCKVSSISVKEVLHADFQFTRGSSATRVNEQGLVEDVTETNLPRINYTDGEGSLLLEPQSTNLMPYSEDFTQWTNSTTNLDVPSNVTQTNPSGGSESGFININNGVSATKFIYEPISTTSSIHTQSVFFKYHSRQWVQLVSGGTSHYANFDIQNGVVGNVSGCTATIEDYGSGWYKCTATLTSAATPINIAIVVLDDDAISRIPTSTGTGSYYVWGAQAEALPYATSYIPTNGSTVTRLADICNNSGNSDLINSTEGVLYAEVSALQNGGTHRIISLSDETNNNLMFIRLDVTANRIVCFGRGSGGSYNFLTTNGVDQTNNNKIALVWDDTNVRVWINGSQTITQTINNSPIGMSTLSFTNPTGSENLYGNVKCLAVFKEALSDTELQKLTTI